MYDMDKILRGLERCFHGQECCGDTECPYYIEHLSDCCCLEECQENLKADVIALLKEQDEIISNLNEATKNLLQQITDIKEYMTPYGKVRDIKAACEQLEKQPEIIRCKDCKHGRLYAENCVDCELNVLAKDADWFCADGRRRDDIQ